MTTAYDRVAYPTAIFAQSHPERLAILAKLAGLDPPDPSRARILEVGGGDCVSLLSLATAWPECEAHGFDLSETAIARGQAFASAAGLSHVSLVVEDILSAHRRYAARSFDYVIAHGVYAWVPPAVREAIMALMGHVLSDRGVGFVSYNCMPGGHIRLIMREMLLNEIGGIEDPDKKIAALRDFLTDYAKPQEGDEALTTTLRHQAESMLQRPDAVLFHDELGDCYYPQLLGDVAAHGAQHGLLHLTDAGRNRHLDGFLDDNTEVPADPDDVILREEIRSDYRDLRYFRQTVFVRAEQQLDRRIDASRIAGMFVSSKMTVDDDGGFVLREEKIALPDTQLADGIARACKASPQRIPVADFATTPEHLRIVLQMFTEWYVNLHLEAAPFVAVPGANPETSPLVRAMMGMGEHMICTLDHSLLRIDQSELRALLMAADGSKTLAELAEAGHGIPPEETGDALAASAARGLIWR